MTALARVVVVCGLLGAASQLPLAVASASVTPSSEMRAVIAAADGERSVKVVSTGSLGSVRLTITGTAGIGSGTQKIDYDLDGVSHYVQIVLVNDVVYVEGDATVLEKYMGLKTNEAKAVAGKWFKMFSNVSDYAAVSAGLTVDSVVSAITMSGAIRALANQKLDGKSVVALVGHSVASSVNGPSLPETLYAAARGKPLPIKVVQTESGHTGTITFADWNQAFAVGVPSTTLTFQSSWLS